MRKVILFFSLALMTLMGIFATPVQGMLANREYRRAHPTEFTQTKASTAQKMYIQLALGWENFLSAVGLGETRAANRVALLREAQRLGIAVPGYTYQLGQQHYNGSTLVAKRRELETLEGQMQAKRKENAVIFQEAGPELNMDNVKSISGDSSAKVKHIQNINAELADMGQKRDALAAEVKTLAEFEANMKAGQGFDQFQQAPESEARGKSRMGLGKSFVESAAYKGRKNEQSATLDVDLKALFATSAGWAPETTRTGVVVPGATRPLQIIDVIPQMPTGQAAVKYMVETFANAAAEVAEGGTYAEATLSYAEASQVVQKVAVYLPVTDEQLDDVAEAEAYVEQRLPFMVQQRLDSQLLVGNGTAPNLRGILNVVGIQTQARSTDPTPDAVYKAIVKVQAVGFANPDVFITHPNDWQDIRLLKTADGIYIWGSPSEAGPQRIWGLNVVVATAITENTGLVGDFAAFSAFYLRKGVEVQYGFINDDFIKGRKALRADLRGAMVVYRPAAFCTVTGI